MLLGGAARTHHGRRSRATTRSTPTLRDAVFQGSKVQLHFAGADGDQLLVETADLADGLPAPGTAMQLGWAVADTLIYPRAA